MTPVEKHVRSATGHEHAQSIHQMLRHIRKKGVRIWHADGQVHYAAPKGVLTASEIQILRTMKTQLLPFLDTTSGKSPESKLAPRHAGDLIPLTFSQEAGWHLLRLKERTSLLQIASAMRLRGQLNVSALSKSIAHIVARHESLRTRIVICDEQPVQRVDERPESVMVMHDLKSIPADQRELKARRLIEAHVLQPINLAVGPVFAAVLVRLCVEEHVLLVAIDHMVADAASLEIVVREIFDAYQQLARDRAPDLPQLTVQLPDYAVWQRRALGPWLQRHSEYWSSLLSQWPATRFPLDNMSHDAPGGPTGWGVVCITVEKALTEEIREWCRRHETTLPICFLAIYAKLLSQWCRSDQILIRYQITGRHRSELSNMVGFLSTALYVPLQLGQDQSFLDLVRHVTAAYCTAHEHEDFSYLESKEPRPAHARCTTFNWVPSISLPPHEGDLMVEDFPFTNPPPDLVDWDCDPGTVFCELDDAISGNCYFPSDRFAADTMQAFGREYLALLGRLPGDTGGTL